MEEEINASNLLYFVNCSYIMLYLMMFSIVRIYKP